MAEEKKLAFRAAAEVEDIALELIPKHHASLTNQKIIYLFRTEPEKVGGRTALGTARKVGGLNAFLAGEFGDVAQPTLTSDGEEAAPESFFVIQVWEFGWTRLTEAQRFALVDHELCHCFAEDGKISIVPHDLEEFIGVVHRHGMWYPDVEAFVKVAARKAREDHEDLFAEAIGGVGHE